ncbi:MAG: RNA methyltransferase [Candidatus Odinarchaeia archaeon]
MRKKFLTRHIMVVLIEPENSGNIGAVARVMKNFGLEKLVLVNPKAEVDSQALAFAMHGRSILDKVRVEHDISNIISESDLVIGTTAISGGDYNPLRNSLSVSEIKKLEFPENGVVSILFGRESRGLSNSELNLCDFILTIPASEDYPTLNISQAAGIIFYELHNLQWGKSFSKSRLAKRFEKELIIDFIEKIIETVNIPAHKCYSTIRVFKNLIGRALITGREAYTLIGLFRKTLDCLKK